MTSVLNEISKDGKLCTEFRGLEKAWIFGTEKEDIYNLIGCEFSHVYTRNDNQKDTIAFYDRHLSDGTVQETTYNGLRLDNCDIVQDELPGNLRCNVQIKD